MKIHKICRLFLQKNAGATAIALIQSCLALQSAHAQTANTSSIADDSDQIIVTARRVEENLQDVPVAVTAFGGAALRERQIESAADLQFNVPSLSVTPSVGGNGANYGLRGQRQGIGNTQGVVTYFAEIPVSATSTYRQTFDMASIQVLKGPQGTLFGANSNGGAVLFVPQRPKDRFEGEIQAAVGSYALRDLTAMLNLPVADWLQVRAAGNLVRRHGYTKNLNPCPRALRPVPGTGSPPASLQISPSCASNAAQDDDRHESWRLSIALKPAEWLSNDLVYWGINEHSVGSSWVPFRFGGPLTGVVFANPIAGLVGLPIAQSVLAEQIARGPRAVFTDEQLYRYREHGVSNITSIDAGPFTIKNIYGFRASRGFQHRDQDGSALPYVQQDTYVAGYTRTHTDELQLIGDLFDDKIKYVVGGFLSRQHNPGQRQYAFLYKFTDQQNATLRALGLSSLIFPNPVTGSLPPVDERTRTNALFANVDIDLSSLIEGLRLSGGYRYTWNRVRTIAPQNRVNGVCTATSNRNQTVDPASCSLIGTINDKGYNYSATVQYDVADRTMLYLSTRRGFKPGGVNQIAVVDPDFFFYRPETITDYEIGLKSEFFVGDVGVRANIAAYTSTYKDIQRSEVVQQSSGAPAITTFNAQKATIRGIEPELSFKFGPAVDLSVFYSLIDAKFDKYAVPGPNDTVINKTGTRFTAVSRHTIGATLVVRPPIPESWGALTATANIYYRSGQIFADDNLNKPSDLRVPGYSIVNARLDWKVPTTDLTLSAAVSNLFDKTYATGGADYTGSVVGYANNNYGAPRMFRFEASYRF